MSTFDDASADAGGLPALYCPIAPAVHPAADEIDQAALEWAGQRGLCDLGGPTLDDLKRINSGDLVARVFPTGRTDALIAITKFYYWGFVLDDILEDAASHDRLAEPVSRHGRIQRALETPSGSLGAADPFLFARQELRDQFAALCAPAVLRRCKEFNRAFAVAMAWESSYRGRGAVPALDDAVAIRMHVAGGALYGTGLIEIAEGFEIDDDDLDRPMVKALTEATWLAAAWANDLYSYWAEAQRGIDGVNLVTVLAHERDLEPAAAMAGSILIHNQLVGCYLRGRERVFGTAGASLRRYLAGLDHLIRGNLDWGIRNTRRYAAAADGRAALTLRDHGADDDRPPEAPPQIASIDWWWDVLGLTE
ncbi:MAG: terpene synthase family protein [Stackebrandtia sp.]